MSEQLASLSNRLDSVERLPTVSAAPQLQSPEAASTATESVLAGHWPPFSRPVTTLAFKQPPGMDPGQTEDNADQDAGADANARGNNQGGVQTLGKAPESNTMQFLRQQSVLLTPGATQMDVGLAYTNFQNDFPQLTLDNTGNINGVVNVRQRTRLVYVPLALRYGLTKDIQLFGFMPVGYFNNQTSATAIGYDETHSGGGQGDITAGANIHLMDGCGYEPDVILNTYFTAPSGNFNSPLFGLVPGSALGQGFGRWVGTCC